MAKKFLKSLMCLCLILCVFTFVACTNNKPETPPNNNNNNNGNQQTEITTSSILKTTYQKMYQDMNNTNGEENSYFAYNSNGTYKYSAYDEYVYSMMSIINKLSEVEQLTENTWLYGREVVSKTEEANKVQKFYISNNKKNDVYMINIYVLYSLKDIDFVSYDRSYYLYNFQIIYNDSTKKINTDVVCEKSKNYYDSSVKSYDATNSYADYYYLSYNSGVDIEVTQFKRKQNFVNNINLVPVIFGSYSKVYFLFGQNTEIIKVDKTDNIDANSAEDIFDRYNACEEISNFVKNIKVNENNLHERISIDLFKYVNANKIKDFA